MLKKRIVFLASKPIGYECFAWLISKRDELNIEICGLLTNTRKEFGDDHDLKALAADNQVPLLTSLDELPECDLLYSVQYHQILKNEHIAKASQAAVNLHMAPLPEYRGSNQFSCAILDDKKEFGTTIHKIDTRIDHGDILFQKRFPIPTNCWVHDLYMLTYNASLNLFRQTLAHVISGNYTPVPQSSLEGRFGTSLHYRNEMAVMKVIDLDWPADKMERHIRATAMPGFEPPYCLLNGEKVFFTRKS